MKPSIKSMALSLVLLSGCATAQPDLEPWSEDRPLIVQSLQDAHVSSAELQVKLDALDMRMLDLERVSSEQQTKILMLESAVAAKKAGKPRKTKKGNATKKNAKLNKRLDAMSKEPTVKNIEASIIQPKPRSDEKNMYTAAYLALKSGR